MGVSFWTVTEWVYIEYAPSTCTLAQAHTNTLAQAHTCTSKHTNAHTHKLTITRTHKHPVCPCCRFDGDGVESSTDSSVDKTNPWSRSIEDLHGGGPLLTPPTSGNSLSRVGRHSTLRYQHHTHTHTCSHTHMLAHTHTSITHINRLTTQLIIPNHYILNKIKLNIL